MPDGGHCMSEPITFERDDKIRDVAAFLESNGVFLRALPMLDSETFADALSVAQVGEVDVMVATNNATLNTWPLCGLRFGNKRGTLVSGGTCRMFFAIFRMGVMMGACCPCVFFGRRPSVFLGVAFFLQSAVFSSY